MIVGKHLIAELIGCKRFLGGDEIEHCLAEAAKYANANLLKVIFHEFGVAGEITAVALLSESHISIHCWPEYEFVACDIFVCGEAEPEKALAILKKNFQTEDVRISLIKRGVY